MAKLTIRIRPTTAKIDLLRQRRGFFGRLTQPLYRARMQKLLATRKTAPAERRPLGAVCD